MLFLYWFVSCVGGPVDLIWRRGAGGIWIVRILFYCVCCIGLRCWYFFHAGPLLVKHTMLVLKADSRGRSRKNRELSYATCMAGLQISMGTSGHKSTKKRVKYYLLGSMEMTARTCADIETYEKKSCLLMAVARTKFSFIPPPLEQSELSRLRATSPRHGFRGGGMRANRLVRCEPCSLCPQGHALHLPCHTRVLQYIRT